MKLTELCARMEEITSFLHNHRDERLLSFLHNYQRVFNTKYCGKRLSKNGDVRINPVVAARFEQLDRAYQEGRTRVHPARPPRVVRIDLPYIPMPQYSENPFRIFNRTRSFRCYPRW